MNTTLRVLATALVLLMAAGCNRDGLQLPDAVDEKDDRADQAANDPYMVSATAAKTGSAVDENGDISEPKTTFAPNDTVFLSMDAKGRRMGDRVRVYWFNEDGKSRKEDEKVLEGPFVYFEYQPTESGKFHAEVDVNERPIGLVDFDVK